MPYIASANPPPRPERCFGRSMAGPCKSPIDTRVSFEICHSYPGRGVISGIDSTPPAQERTLKEDTPIIVVLHGLTGGAVYSPEFGAYQCSYRGLQVPMSHTSDPSSPRHARPSSKAAWDIGELWSTFAGVSRSRPWACAASAFISLSYESRY